MGITTIDDLNIERRTPEDLEKALTELSSIKLSNKERAIRLRQISNDEKPISDTKQENPIR